MQQQQQQHQQPAMTAASNDSNESMSSSRNRAMTTRAVGREVHYLMSRHHGVLCWTPLGSEHMYVGMAEAIMSDSDLCGRNNFASGRGYAGVYICVQALQTFASFLTVFLSAVSWELDAAPTS